MIDNLKGGRQVQHFSLMEGEGCHLCIATSHNCTEFVVQVLMEKWITGVREPLQWQILGQSQNRLDLIASICCMRHLSKFFHDLVESHIEYATIQLAEMDVAAYSNVPLWTTKVELQLQHFVKNMGFLMKSWRVQKLMCDHLQLLPLKNLSNSDLLELKTIITSGWDPNEVASIEFEIVDVVEKLWISPLHR